MWLGPSPIGVFPEFQVGEDQRRLRRQRRKPDLRLLHVQAGKNIGLGVFFIHLSLRGNDWARAFFRLSIFFLKSIEPYFLIQLPFYKSLSSSLLADQLRRQVSSWSTLLTGKYRAGAKGCVVSVIVTCHWAVAGQLGVIDTWHPVAN